MLAWYSLWLCARPSEMAEQIEFVFGIQASSDWPNTTGWVKKSSPLTFLRISSLTVSLCVWNFVHLWRIHIHMSTNFDRSVSKFTGQMPFLPPTNSVKALTLYISGNSVHITNAIAVGHFWVSGIPVNPCSPEKWLLMHHMGVWVLVWFCYACK